jgi:RNA polymerase sigma factor (sigma-70 family)
VLYERHVDAARRLARSQLRNHADADDVVSEVFASVLAVIQRGKGPRDGFAAYLMASVRHECHRARRKNGRATQVPTTPDRPMVGDLRGLEVDPFARRDEVEVLQQALRSLPLGARDVLWRTEVEGQSHQEIAEQTGSTPQAVAAHAMRARRALGEAYLRGHLVAPPDVDPLPRPCADARQRLADLVRGSISRRLHRRLEAHLATCPSCSDARDELERVNRHLRTAPGLPLAVGAGILRLGLKARLTAFLAASGAPLVAATGLVVVCAVVPLSVARRADSDARVAVVNEPAAEVAATAEAAATATTVPASRTGVSRPPDDVDPVPARDPPATSTTVPPAPSGPAPSDPTTTTATTTPPPGGSVRPAVPSPAVTTPPATTSPPVTAPPISLPPVSLPPISLPPVSLPPIELPGVTTPAISVPAVSLPLVTVPSVTVPSVSVPPVTITVPPITVPPITVPPITLPPITLPPIGG